MAFQLVEENMSFDYIAPLTVYAYSCYFPTAIPIITYFWN